VFKVCVFERGAARPGPKNAAKLANALGVPADRLFPHLKGGGHEG
jgi:transcriptional regulator with XRE-family HTH domain